MGRTAPELRWRTDLYAPAERLCQSSQDDYQRPWSHLTPNRRKARPWFARKLQQMPPKQSETSLPSPPARLNQSLPVSIFGYSVGSALFALRQLLLPAAPLPSRPPSAIGRCQTSGLPNHKGFEVVSSSPLCSPIKIYCIPSSSSLRIAVHLAAWRSKRGQMDPYDKTVHRRFV